MLKELYILGAGASKASADTPMGSELLWSYYQDCCLMTPIIDGKPNTKDSDTEFINYVEFLKAVVVYFPDLKGEVNNFLNRGIHIYGGPYSLRKEHYVDDLLQRTQEANDDKTTELIRQLIFEHLSQASFGRPNKLYELFTSKILRYKNPEQVSIISFNFDYLLSEDYINDVYFDYSLDFDWIDKNRELIYRRRNPISLIKLNGSLDWGICNNCGSLHLYFPNMHRFFYLEQSCRMCNGKIDPYIVIPHQEYDKRIQLLWGMANTLIKQAEKINIIGYSFPHYDTRVIKLFRDSFQTGTLLEVVDVCSEGENEIAVKRTIEEKYKKMFPNILDIKINTTGFQGFLEGKIGVAIT